MKKISYVFLILISLIFILSIFSRKPKSWEIELLPSLEEHSEFIIYEVSKRGKRVKKFTNKLEGFSVNSSVVISSLRNNEKILVYPEGVELIFKDTTIRPGRWVLRLGQSIVDIMPAKVNYYPNGYDFYVKNPKMPVVDTFTKNEKLSGISRSFEE
ncbi:MAG: hypothetical protein ACYTFY_14185 [Planctomycetota bacterium]